MPAKPEWVLVRSRRSVTTVIEDAKKMKKDKKGQSEQVTTQIPSSNGKPIANGKSVVSGKPVANGKPEVDGKPKKQFKKSNTIIDKWAKSGSIEALEDIAEKAPKSVPAAKYVADSILVSFTILYPFSFLLLLSFFFSFFSFFFLITARCASIQEGLREADAAGRRGT